MSLQGSAHLIEEIQLCLYDDWVLATTILDECMHFCNLLARNFGYRVFRMRVPYDVQQVQHLRRYAFVGTLTRRHVRMTGPS